MLDTKAFASTRTPAIGCPYQYTALERAMLPIAMASAAIVKTNRCPVEARSVAIGRAHPVRARGVGAVALCACRVSVARRSSSRNPAIYARSDGGRQLPQVGATVSAVVTLPSLGQSSAASEQTASSKASPFSAFHAARHLDQMPYFVCEIARGLRCGRPRGANAPEVQGVVQPRLNSAL